MTTETTQPDIPLADYQPDDQALSERIIMITGAGSGLGRALAIELGKRGATIILVGRTTKKLEQVYDEIEAAGGPQPAIFPMNLASASEQEFIGLAAAIEQNFGCLHGLILNAAHLGQHSPIVHTELEQWQHVLQVNLTANFLFCKHFAGLLNAADKASLLFVTDQLVQHGKAYWSGYGSSKSAMDYLMQCAADEWETNTNIYVNSIAPPAMPTSLRRQAFPAEDRRVLPEPDAATLPFMYLLDTGKNWPRGRRFFWDLPHKKLTNF